MSTLAHALRDAGGEQALGLRLLDRKLRETVHPWSDVLARSEAVAGSLQALGVRPGDRVGLIFPTGIEFIAAFFGAQLAGAVPTPMYPPLRLGRMEAYHDRTVRMMQTVDVRLLLTDDRVWRVIGESLERARPALGGMRLSKLPPGPFRPVPVDAEDLGLVQFSSGTTGHPKGVALTHRALLAQTDMLIEALLDPFDETDDDPASGCSWLPLYHDMGLVGSIFVAVRKVRDLTLIAPQDFLMQPSLWLQGLSRSRAWISPAPNFAYGYCAARIRDDELDGVDLSAWKWALNGAEPVSPTTMRTFTERFQPWGFRTEAMVPVYGLSEGALAVSFSSPFEPPKTVRFNRHELGQGVALPDPDGLELVSVGTPLTGVSMRCVDDAGQDLPDGRVGRLWIRSPSLMREYLGHREATDEALHDGWLDTGDLAMTHEGEWYILGRAKDVLIVAGRNYAAHDLEHAVDGIPGVRVGCSAAVGWMPDGAENEHIALLVEHEKGATTDELTAMPDRCTEAILARVGIAVDEVVVLGPGTLPRTTSGRIRRRESLRQLLDGELSPPDQVSALHLAGLLTRSGLAHVRAWAGRRRPGDTSSGEG